MHRFFKSPALLASIAAVAVFMLSAAAWTADELSDATAVVTIVACIAGLWRWAPTGWRVFWKGANRTEDWGILAICILLISLMFSVSYGLAYRQLGRPDALMNSDLNPFFLYMRLCAVVLLVAATKDEASK